MPAALTGPLGTVGQQTKRGAEFYAKVQNAKGGILGRKIELLIEDTAGNPATCVRKAQEMVERHGVPLFTGLTLSSEALAVVPKLAEWNCHLHLVRHQRRRAPDRRELRAELLPRQHLRAHGRARRLALPARGQDQELLRARASTTPGATTACRCSRDEMKRANKNFIGKVFAPDRHQGLFDLHHQDPPVGRRRPAISCCRRRQQRVPVAGARSTSCPTRWRMLTEQIELVAASRRRRRLSRSGRLLPLLLHHRHIRTTRSSSSSGSKEHNGGLPDTFEGETWQACR